MTLTGRMILAACALIVARASVSSAQTCTGLPAFNGANVQLNGGGYLAKDAKVYGGGITVGSRGPYAGVVVGGISYDDVDGKTLVAGGDLGYQVPLGAAGAAQFCPVAGFTLGFGPKDIDGLGTDLSTRSFTAGGRLGFAMGNGSAVQFVPSAGLSVEHAILKLKQGSLELDESETYGVAEVGFGLIFDSVVGIRPSASIPFGVDNAEPTYGVILAINMGRLR